MYIIQQCKLINSIYIYPHSLILNTQYLVKKTGYVQYVLYYTHMRNFIIVKQSSVFIKNIQKIGKSIRLSKGMMNNK